MTAPDVPQLVSTLKQAIRADGHLPFTGELVSDADLTALLTPLFTDGTVDIAGASAAPNGDGTSALATGTVTFGSASCAATLTLTPSGDAVQLLLVLTPSAGSTLPDLFTGVIDPILCSVALATGGVVVSSGDHQMPGGHVVHRGMGVVGDLDIAASYPSLAPMLGAHTVALTGAVTDPVLPLFALATDATSATLGPLALASVVLRFAMCDIADGTPATAAAQASLSATATLGKDVTGTVTADLAPGSLMALDIAFSGVNLGDLTLLEPFLGPADPFTALPKEIRDAITKAASLIELRSLALSFDAAAATFRSVGIVVGIDLKGFAPFPPLPHLTFDQVLIAWTVDLTSSPAAMTFTVTTDLHLTETCPVVVDVRTQPAGGYQIDVRQAPGAVLMVSDVVTAVLPGLTLPELDVTDFLLTLAPRESFYTVGMTISGSWTALAAVDIAMASVSIQAHYQGGVQPPLSGSVRGTVSFEPPAGPPAPQLPDAEAAGVEPPQGTIDLFVVAERPPGTDSWVLAGGTGDGEAVPVGDLVAALAAKFGVSGVVPAPLSGLTITNLGTRLDESSESFSFGCALGFPVGDTDETVEATVDLAVTGPSGSREIAFGGSVLMGQLEFDLRFDHRANGADVVLGEFLAKGDSGTVDVKKLIGEVLPDVAAALPDGLVLDLADATIALVNSAQGRKFLFAMDLALEFPLSDLPLIGPALPASAKAGVKDLKLIVTSAPLTAAEVTTINALAPKPVLPPPATATTGDTVAAGFSMAATLELGTLQLLMTSPPPARQPPATLALAGQSDPTSWIQVQKSLGPVTIQKVGFAYRDGSLFVLANLEIAAGPLTIDLIGLGMGSPLTDPKPRFTIQGLGVSFTAGPVAVAGGMIGTLDPVDFTGALSVRAPELSLAALAGYAEYDDFPSFFLYGVLNAPLGGPPAFFVTGVAAGMGFNRKLVVPDVAGVTTFPLVLWAQGVDAPAADPAKPIGDQVANALTKLSQSGVVAPSIGDYWFAAGVHFSSYELVDTFALLLVSVGTDVEIDLIGLSTVTVPPKDPSPVAEVQLALEASFSWQRGLVEIAGQLTANSYVLSRDCRLTGGFAFCLWFRGRHAGETVLTLGGYNPAFTIPDHYPKVPRIGLDWRVVPELTITGGLYFAVTPNVIMAGGKLSAVWQSGPVKAWFTYWADFLMTFSPLHYYVDGGIDLGASFTAHLWLFSVSVTIHVGVDLALWGPEFAGRAVVDLDIISFTIHFNDHAPQTQTTISWQEFVEKLLPAAGRQDQLAPRETASEPAIVRINVTSGLVRALPSTTAGPCYLVNAETFACAVVFVIPVKTVTFAEDPDKTGCTNLSWAPDDEQPCDDNGHPIPANTDFGVGPAGIAATDFNPQLTLALSTPEDSTLRAVRQLANAPKALWEKKSFDSHGVQKVDGATALTEASITDALTGLTLVPYVEPPDYLRPVPLESLLFTLDDVEPFAWSTGSAPTTDPFTDETVATTVTAAPVAHVRTVLLDALAGQGVRLDTTVAVDGLADPAGDDLLAPPRMRLLGETRDTEQS